MPALGQAEMDWDVVGFYAGVLSEANGVGGAARNQRAG
jgi:hypothetical protein